MRRLSILLAILVAVLLLGIGGVYWWAGTDGSLPRALRLAQGYLPAEQSLQFDTAQGSIRHGGRITGLQWSQPGTRVTIDELQMAWTLRALSGRALHVGRLEASQVLVELTPAPDQAPSEPFEMPQQLHLPLNVSVPLDVQRLQLDRTDEAGVTTTQVIEDIALRYDYDGARHALDVTRLRHGRNELSGKASLQAADLALDGEFVAALRDLVPDSPLAMQVQLTTSGTLSGGEAARVDINLQARESRGDDDPVVRLEADLALHPWRAQPLQQLDLVARDLDARSFSAAAPVTQLGGTAQVLPAAVDGTWDVRVDLTNAAAGTWDRERIPLGSLTARGQLTAEQLELLQAEALLRTPSPAGSVSITGTVPLSDPMTSALRLVLADVDLQPWAAGLPHTALAGEATLSPLAGEEGWQIQAAFDNAEPGRLDAERLPVERLLADARITPALWRADTLELHIGEGRVQLGGEFDPEARSLQARGELRALPLRRIHTRLAGAASAVLSGELNASGDLDRGIDFSADIASTAGAGAPRGEWELRAIRGEGQWSPARLAVRSLHLDAFGARVDGEGIEVTLPDLASVTGKLSGTAPGLTLAADASMAQGAGSGSMDLQLSSAEQVAQWLRGLPVIGETLPSLQARGRAGLVARWQGGWQQWLQGLENPAQHPDLQAEVTLQAQSLQVDLPPAAQGDPGTSIAASQFEARLQGNLAAAELVVDGDLRANDTAAVLDARLRMAQAPVEGVPRWQISVDRLGAAATLPSQAQPWRLEVASGLQVTLETGEALRVEATAGEATLSPPRDVAADDGALRLAWEPLSWNRAADGATRLASRGRLEGLRPAWIDPLLASPDVEGPLAAAGLYTDLLLSGDWDISMDERLDIQAHLRREQGDLGFGQERGEGVAAGIRTFDARVQSEGEAVALALDWDTERAGVITARMRTTLTQQGGGWQLAEDAPLSGTLQARLQDLGLWGFLAPPGWRVQGALDADVRLAGTVQSPLLQGEIAGNGLNIRSVLDGVDLHDGVLRARLQGSRLELAELTLQGGTGSRAYVRGLSGNRTPPPTDRGRMTATGYIDWSGAADAASGQTGIALDLNAKLEKMQVLVRNDRQVSLSGDLSAGLQQGRLRVRGNVAVDRAAIVLPEAGAPTLGDDVVVVRTVDLQPDGEPEPRGELRTAQPMDLQIQLDLGRDLALEGYGITTRLEGELTVSSTSNGADPFRIVGEVRTSEGRFRAWGQALNVENGVVLFNGPYSNPSLNLLAIRPEIAVRAGVRVTGTLSAPRVQLYSEPEMPESEKLSWVVLGRAAATSGAEGTSMQQAALGLLAGGVGSSLAQGLGLDELGMGDSSVSIGKRISDELYVTYEAGLSGAASTLYVFYDITRRFTVRGQTGEASAMDLIYTFTYD